MPAASAPAAAKPANATAHGSAGRAAMAGTVQPKLDVGPVGGRYEREADSVARQVMSGGSAQVAVPPTITPLSAQRKAMPTATAKPAKEEEKSGKSVQRKEGAGNSGGEAPTSVESSIARMQSSGAAQLDGGTRGFMESRFGRDFSGVRVHKDSGAASAAQALNARAFTVGNDVFFNAGEYRPHSPAGRELLAHELTHTVQQAGQRGVAARKVVQRDNHDEEDAAPDTSGATGGSQTVYPIPGVPGASIDLTGSGGSRGKITVPQLGLPLIAGALKGAVGGTAATPSFTSGRSLPVLGQPLEFRKPMPRRDEDSIPAQVWTESARAAGGFASGMRSKLTEMIASDSNHYAFQEGDHLVYYMQLRQGSTNQMFIGTIDQLIASDALLRPQWKEDGTQLFSRTERYDADHFLEMQVGGADELANMWLLKASYNRSVGSQLARNIRNDLSNIIERAENIADLPEGAAPESVDEAKLRWDIRFSEVVQGEFASSAGVYFWTRGQIARGDHLTALKFLSEQELIDAGVRPNPGVQPTRVRIFPSPEGGFMKQLRIRPDGSVEIPSDKVLFTGIEINSATYNSNLPVDAENADLMTLDVTVIKTKRNENEEIIERKRGPVTVKSAPRLGIAGYLSRQSIMAAARTTRFKALSPLTFSDMGVSTDGALTGIGTVGSTKLLLPGLNVPLTLYGDEIRMDFPIPAERLSLGPFSVTEASLGLGVGDGGFFVEGYAGFEIRELGTGSVTATGGEDGVQIAGLFNLNTDFFNPASVEVSYDFSTDELVASATLGVEQGRLPGVDSGQVTVTITRDTVDVTGTVNLGGPLAGSSIDVGYTQEEGLTIGGTFPLPISNIPAIRDATITVGAARDPESGAWSISGAGTATLAVPGATGSIEIAYLDGVVTLTTTAAVEKGPASGTLSFTATNGVIDDEGNPVEGEIGNSIAAWGRGSVTIRFGSIIEGTAGIEYTQDNRIILSGRIALPPVYEIFPRREYQRDLLHLEPPEFPIWGVSVAGVGVGIFAFVDARISFNAYVGPGQIRDAAIEAEMDLDHPEDATIHGEAEFFVPAYAGLNLDVGGGLRARLAVAYAQGRVGLEGRLGIEADASASVGIDWNRADGLSLEADFEANARPKFELLANASVTVGVDLLVTDVSHTFGPWERSLGEFGPDMEMGVDFPVTWSEADGLDLSLDNMTIREPQLDASGLMGDVFDRLAA